MAKILVSLVSDQTIPNVIFIREMEGIGRYIFVSTERMEQQGKSDWIIKGAGLNDADCRKIVVVEDSLADILEKLRGLDFNDEDEFQVNLTGGTKVMSIGVYNFFRSKSSEIFYLMIGKNVYRKIFPEVKKKEFEIDFRVGVSDYLASYGIEIVNPQAMNTLVKNPADTEAFAAFFINADDDERLSPLDQLRKFRSKKNIYIEKVEGLENLLAESGFKPEAEGKLNKKEIAYLTGEWFEGWCYGKLKQSIGLTDDNIGIDLKIVRNNIENQFDVMFTVGNALHVIECKSSIYDQISGRNVLNQSVYKLAALRNDFGLRVPSFIFTMSDRGEEKKHVRQLDVDRSKFMGIDIVDRTGLTEEFETFLSRVIK